MLTLLREEWQFYLLILAWVVTAHIASPLVYLLLPASVFLLRSKDMMPEILFGFFMVLVLSDVHKSLHGYAVFKSAKNLYIVSVAALFLLETARFVPLSSIFKLFLPFFAYSVFSLVFSPSVIIGVQKTLSYALLFLVVPNFVLYCYRAQGWQFMRNLVYFLVSIVLMGLYFRFIGEGYYVGRFKGIFGNPNGLGTFSFLTIVLITVVHSRNKQVFRLWELLVLYAVLLAFLLASGSRASLVAVMIFFLFHRFFSRSIFLGFVAFIVFIVLFEIVYTNLGAVVMALGAEEYLRVNTLESGSGRYFAWEFAWEKIQEYLVFGGGFGTDEHVMRSNYGYLLAMNHEGGVHNSFLSFWFDFGIVGLLIYFRSFFLLFIKATKRAPISLAVMFSVLFSATYESWLVSSLNPFTIFLLCIVTILYEDEIVPPGEAPLSEEEHDGLAEGGTSVAAPAV